MICFWFTHICFCWAPFLWMGCVDLRLASPPGASLWDLQGFPIISNTSAEDQNQMHNLNTSKHCCLQKENTFLFSIHQLRSYLSSFLVLCFYMYIFQLWKEAKTQRENHLMEDKKKKKQEEKKKKDAAQKKVNLPWAFYFKTDLFPWFVHLLIFHTCLVGCCSPSLGKRLGPPL